MGEEYYIIDYDKDAMSIETCVPNDISEEEKAIGKAMLAATSMMSTQTKGTVLLMLNTIDPDVKSPIDMANYLLTIWNKEKVKIFLAGFTKFMEDSAHE